MADARLFENLDVWTRSRRLVKAVYRCSNQDGFSRDFALKDQMRRAAISVLSNIAEGYERDGNAEFLQFLSISKGSCGELRAPLYVAFDLEYVSVEQFEWLINEATEVSRMLSGLMKHLRRSEYRGLKYECVASNDTAE
jgi:four helix bundle protein